MANGFASYRDMLNTGLFSSEANCLQYLLDVSILPTQKRCPSCIQWMMILPCSPSSYPDGVCWQCCNKRISLRSDSILSRRKLTYRQFIDLLYEFSRGSSISEAATAVGLSIPTVRSLFNEIRERMAEEITTTPKIGGPGRIVEIDEAKFGKRKYQRGRIVQGSWILGGVERHSNKCFLAICPFNRRNESTLLPIIQNYVAPGTTIITDKWKAYINLQNHGYVHLDVNHSQNFVDPESGAHTNRIEGTWTHVKNRAQRRGGRRSPDHLARDLTEFMWLRQKGLLSSADRARLMFARELPQLLNFRNFV